MRIDIVLCYSYARDRQAGTHINAGWHHVLFLCPRQFHWLVMTVM